MRVILLNGPPRVGKDTAARALMATHTSIAHIGFAHHLKRATHAAYGMPPEYPYDAFEAVKDEPRAEFFGLTPRAAYIAHSEKYMKVLHGKRVFGNLFMRAARASEADTVAVSDSGFVDEGLVVCEDVGPQNVLLIQIYQEGRTFEGDSRSYITLPGVTLIQIENHVGKEIAFGADVVRHARAWAAG